VPRRRWNVRRPLRKRYPEPLHEGELFGRAQGFNGKIVAHGKLIAANVCPKSLAGITPILRPATVVGDRYDSDSLAINLKNDSIWEPLHAGLSMNCIQPAKPVGLMCRTFDRVGILFCEACGCGFTSRGVSVEGGVEVRLGARKKHNLRHGPYYSLGGER